MSTLSLRLPDSLHDAVRELAQEDSTSINQFTMLAVAEKIAALRTVDYLAERAKQADRDAYLAVFAKAPAVEPEEFERIML